MAPGSRAGALRRALRPLASLRLTAALILALCVVLVLDAEEVLPSEWPRVGLLFALGTNLVATVGVRWRSFVRKPGLLGFHLALLALCAAAGAGRLVYLSAVVEVVEGQAVALKSQVRRRGSLAPAWLDAVRLRLLRSEATYHRGGTLLEGHADLEVVGPSGRPRRVSVAVGHPVRAQGLTWTLTPSAGYAAVLRLEGPGGGLARGAVAFPEYRTRRQGQVQALHLPGAPATASVSLSVPDPPVRGERWALAVPREASLTLYHPGLPAPVRVGLGQAVALPEGRLVFEGVRRYARLLVPYDPAAPVVTALFAALPFFLLWHYLWTMRRHPRAGRAT